MEKELIDHLQKFLLELGRGDRKTENADDKGDVLNGFSRHLIIRASFTCDVQFFQ